MLHRLVKQLSTAAGLVGATLPINLIKVRAVTSTTSFYLVKVTNAAPSGTPDACIAINIAAGAAARLYVSTGGAWSALG